MPAHHDFASTFIELGAVVVGLAILARLASRIGFSAIPLYLVAGLAFGNGGLMPLKLSKGFTELGSEIGVLLLLFMLGLEYTGDQLSTNLQRGFPAGVLDLALNFPPGFVAGLLLGWKPLPSPPCSVIRLRPRGASHGEFHLPPAPETPATEPAG